jgi:hypothetical protein
MEFTSLYLMFMYQRWFAPIVFYYIFVGENETPKGLESRPLPWLGWLD